MGCDWDAATAVDTFFKDPEDYGVESFDSLEDLGRALPAFAASLDHDLAPYRNPSSRRLGCVSHDQKLIWSVPYDNLTYEEMPMVQDFRLLATTINTYIGAQHVETHQ